MNAVIKGLYTDFLGGYRIGFYGGQLTWFGPEGKARYGINFYVHGDLIKRYHNIEVRQGRQ
jgi:hypothetical protein